MTASRQPPSSTPRPAPSTPTERGDTDLEGSASSLARQNAPREPNRGQLRDAPRTSNKTEPTQIRGVDDERD